jgi:hypothetical protein
VSRHEKIPHSLNKSSVLEQLRLVLDVIVSDPSLDLVTETLEFLDLSFQVELLLLFLGLVSGRLHLVIYCLEQLNTFGHLFERSVDFS